MFGATLGGLLGSLIKFNTKGIDFVMVAMFVVIFLEQWLKDKTHINSLIGLVISVVCLIIFKADNFILPSMICILAVLTLIRKPLEKGEIEK